MRTSNKNKQKLKYALQVGRVDQYEYDDQGNIKYIDVDGVQVPVTKGNKENGYALPVDFNANISMSNGDTQAVEYGIDDANYDAIIVYEKGCLPIDETSLIWHKTSPRYKDASKTIVDPNSADYRVIRVSESINLTKYVLKKINHG